MSARRNVIDDTSVVANTTTTVFEEQVVGVKNGKFTGSRKEKSKVIGH